MRHHTDGASRGKRATLFLAHRAQEPGNLLHDQLTSHPYRRHRQDTPLRLLLWNCSEMQANWAPVQQDGQTTGGALGGGRALLRPAWVQLNRLRLEFVSFGHQCINGAWLPRRAVSVLQKNRPHTIGKVAV